MNKKLIIDLGSLKAKYSIFDADTSELLSQGSHLTLLGKGIGESGVISGEALDLLQDALIKIKKEMRDHKISRMNTKLIATEALRQAKNKEDVESLVKILFPGRRLEIIDQHQEGDLLFKAISKNFPDTELATIDIGGGSVQIIQGKFNSKTNEPIINDRHLLKTGTYALQQQFSPNNNEVSQNFEKAIDVIKKEYSDIAGKPEILVFGSTCMLDFANDAIPNLNTDRPFPHHPAHVSQSNLNELLTTLRGLAPDSRTHLYPNGGYFIYGADYLLLNLLEAIERLQPTHIYPTNLNSSYGLL